MCVQEVSSMFRAVCKIKLVYKRYPSRVVVAYYIAKLGGIVYFGRVWSWWNQMTEKQEDQGWV